MARPDENVRHPLHCDHVTIRVYFTWPENNNSNQDCRNCKREFCPFEIFKWVAGREFGILFGFQMAAVTWKLIES